MDPLESLLKKDTKEYGKKKSARRQPIDFWVGTVEEVEFLGISITGFNLTLSYCNFGTKNGWLVLLGEEPEDDDNADEFDRR